MSMNALRTLIARRSTDRRVATTPVAFDRRIGARRSPEHAAELAAYHVQLAASARAFEVERFERLRALDMDA